MPVTLHKQLGAIEAPLAYEQDADQTVFPPYRKIELTVARAGRTVLTERLCAGGICEPSPTGALSVRNVWGSAQAEALVEIYTGGAHCCFGSEIVLDGPGGWRAISHNWGDLGYRGQWRGGAYYFITGDDRFAYAFTDFADSVFPMQVWSINGVGHLVDVTRTRLDLVRNDAAILWRGYVKDRATKDTDVRGVLAAWCADEYALGAKAGCDAEVAKALKRGDLNLPGRFGPMGSAFVKELDRELAAWGYTRA